MSKLTFKNVRDEVALIKRRSHTAICVMVVLLLLLLARLFYLTVIEHHYYKTLANENRIKAVPIAPARGLIFDRNGVLLARNRSVYTLSIIPDETEDMPRTLSALKPLVHLSDTDIKHFKRSKHWYHGFESVPLKINLTPEEIANFSVNEYQFPSAHLEADLLREYPEGLYTADTIGYMGRINQHEMHTIDLANYAGTHLIGKSGIETFYETSLHGTVGYEGMEVDATGKPLQQLKVTAPIAGENLHLTLDIRLQRIALNAFHGEQGAAVAIDPRNGQILAMVSSPSFDPNLFVNGITPEQYKTLNEQHALYNRTTRGVYPLASTIKPFIALEALITHTVTPEFTLYDPGYFTLATSSHIFHDWVKNGHGKLNVVGAIAVSCDTFFYYLAHQMGIEHIHDILTAFGFGQAPDINLPGALSGIVPSPEWKEKILHEQWYEGDTLVTGIGQGYVTTTPLQLANATAALAMQGQRFKPTLVLSDSPAPLPAIPMDKDAWNTVIQGMQDVIRSPKGTGYYFGHTIPYTLAAKTGTAQVITRTERAKIQGPIPKIFENNSLFIAFAPVDQPSIAVAVIVEHADRAKYVARAIMDAYFHVNDEKKPTH